MYRFVLLTNEVAALLSIIHDVFLRRRNCFDGWRTRKHKPDAAHTDCRDFALVQRD